MSGSGSDHSGQPEAVPTGNCPVQPEPSPQSNDATPPDIPDHELIRKIGGGSYGEVWLARNTLGTLRAVKTVYRHSFEDHRPFEREFRGIQRFEPISRTHEGLVDILQVGQAEDYFYYVMELADSVPKGAEEPVATPEDYVPRTLRADLKLLVASATLRLLPGSNPIKDTH